MRKGYVGIYNNYLLKSSYEYAYIRFLEVKEYNWGYEDITFDIEGLRYTPDFFIYNKEGEINKIIEVRGGRDEREMSEALNSLRHISNEYDVLTELVTLKDLMKIYKNMPFTFHKVTEEWKNSSETTLQGGYDGEYNPNYGKTHSDKTKKIIGLKAKKRWSNPEYRESMLIKLRNNGEKISKALKGKLKSPRETRHCLFCNEEFEVTIFDKKKYCTLECANKENYKEANITYLNNRHAIHRQVKEFVETWAKKNCEIVQETPFNKISTALDPLVNQIEEKYGVKDYRVISKAVLGNDLGRKQLLQYLKDIF